MQVTISKLEMIQIKISNWVLSILQGLLVLAIIVLEQLTKTKALVMQHIYVKRFEHMKYLTFENRFWMAVTIAAILVIVIMVLKQRGMKYLLSYTLVSLSVITLILLPIQSLMTYSYLIAVLLGIMVLEFLKLGIKERCQ